MQASYELTRLENELRQRGGFNRVLLFAGASRGSHKTYHALGSEI